MHSKLINKAVVFFIALSGLIFSGRAFCQTDFEKTLAKKVDSLLATDKTENGQGGLFPNDALQAMTIPSGWGGYGAYIFGSLGGVYPQVYHTAADLIASGGFCIGNPIKAVNFAASLNMTDVHKFRDFSGNFNVSRVVAPGSISVGGLQLFASSALSDAPGSTFYFTFSHAIQSLPSETPGSSKLTYTIGIGNGRFYLKSPDDVAAGRGKNGTGIFGGVSYELIKHMNIIAEWSGMNLGLSTGIRPFKNPLSFGLGVTNLTRYSANRPNIAFSFGLPLSLASRSNYN